MPTAVPRDRIKELRRVPAKELKGSQWNWRKHPAAQRDAMEGSFAELGIADAVKARVLPDGSLEIFDGHLRQDVLNRVGPDTMVPVLVTDLTEDEAKKALLLMDPIAAMAQADQAALDVLLAQVEVQDEGVQALLADLASDKEPRERAGLEEFEAAPPPRRAWLLIATDDMTATQLESELRERFIGDDNVRIEMSVDSNSGGS